MLAATSISDGIIIILFATFLFLLLVGIYAFLKWLVVRVILRRPRPVPQERMCLVLEMGPGWELLEDDSGGEGSGTIGRIEKFGAYLEARIRREQLGMADGIDDDDRRLELYFRGPDVRRMWEAIRADVMAYAPVRPVEVRFRSGRKRGLGEVEYLSGGVPHVARPLPEFEPWVPAPFVESPAWTWAWRIGGALTLVAVAGLFLSQVFQQRTGMSDRELTQSTLGSAITFTLGGMFITGMVILLICSWHAARSSRADR